MATIAHLGVAAAAEHSLGVAVVLELQPVAGWIDQEEGVMLQNLAGEAELWVHAEDQAGGSTALQQGLPVGQLREHQAEMTGIDAALLVAQAGRIDALSHELVAAQIEDQGINAAAAGHTAEPLDIPALGGIQVEGGDGEVELNPVHGL